MHYENRLIEAQNIFKSHFEKNHQDYKNNCTGNDDSFSKWSSKRKIIEKKLYQEIEKIKIDYFKNNVKRKISSMKGTVTKTDFDFVKFCYYIDRLNTEKISKKILKYNYSYCCKITDAIATEYLKIIRYLNDSGAYLSKINDKEFVNAKNNAIAIWNKMENNFLQKIIDDEYQTVIREIESEVYTK